MGIAGTKEIGNRLAERRSIRRGIIRVGLKIGLIEENARIKVGQEVRVCRKASALSIDHVPQTARRKGSVSAVIGVHGQSDLFEMVPALDSPGRFPGRLDRGQQQADQDAENCNDHQNLDERQTAGMSISARKVVH
jgi:hypothetical protein